MSAADDLRAVIAAEAERLRASVPADQGAVLALVRSVNSFVPATVPSELITGLPLDRPGTNRAFAIALTAARDGAHVADAGGANLETWAADFLERCDRLVLAEGILDHCQSGFIRIVDAPGGAFDLWIAGRRQPAAWRERLDFDWWAHYARQSIVPGALPASAGPGAYRAHATAIVRAMAYQFGYPAEATLGGHRATVYADVLALVIAWALRDRDIGSVAAPQLERELAGRIGEELGMDPDDALDVLSLFTLDWTNNDDHVGVAGVAPAPLVRVGPDHLVGSIQGLLAEPLLFLTRALRRRDAQGYNNSASQREVVFRDDLYGLFADRRFVLAPRRIELRRNQGELRTDIDALVFDRKTGTLGVFELKSQDPFVRTHAERLRQRDNVLYANRQVAGVLAWIKQHSATDLVARFDARAAKTFKASRVLPFVLGRYLVHFPDGAEPDSRAAWGTWPQVLRLLDQQPIRPADGNPLLSLFNRLQRDAPLAREVASNAAATLRIDGSRLTVYPSFAAYQAATADRA